MSAPRPKAPVKPVPEADEDFLYVPDEEVPEALSLGARRIEGEARLLRPRPFPDGVGPTQFARWQGEEARYRWCMRYVGRLLGGAAPLPDFDELLHTLGEGQAAHERVYMFVPAFDLDRARDFAGVYWDKRRRMYYATAEADLNELFCWLSPAAKSIWESERVIQRALTLMVQEQARREVSSIQGAGDTIDISAGAPKYKRPVSRTQAE